MSFSTIYTPPSNYPLRYALPWESKGDLYSRFRRISADSDVFLTQLKAPNKTNLPLLDLYSSFNYPVICADFDILPELYQTWDEFYEYAKAVYSNDGLVTRSPSGKVKVLFQFKSEVYIGQVDAKASLKGILNDEDFELVDKAQAAFNRLYLTERIVSDLQAWIPLVIHEVSVKQADVHTKTLSQLEVEYTFENLTESIERFSEFQKAAQTNVSTWMQKAFNRMETETCDRWAAYFVRYASGLTNGMPLNLQIAATLIGTSQSSVCRVLQKLELLGLMSTSESYSAGFQSKYRKVTNGLADLVQHLTHAPNTDIIESDVPEDNANQYYLKLIRIMYASGYSQTEIIDKLLDKDATRPEHKQRRAGYFKANVKKWVKKCQTN